MTVTVARQISSALLPEAKLWIRRSTASLDSEVEQTVAACLMDMGIVGIKNVAAEDPLIQQAAKLYLKAHFGYDDKSEKWAAAYEHLKASLSLSGTYTEEANNNG